MEPLNQPTNLHTEHVRVHGQVQGVGFRPTVYRIARQLALAGEVLNDGKGVLITLQGETPSIDEFVDVLQQQLPALARIDDIQRSIVNHSDIYQEFQIVQSQATEISTPVTPDAVTCQDCLADINDPDNRRHGYAFTNCTHCGPRLSIVRHIPYDRHNTSMSPFTQCPSCQAEYDNPSDRRFHAQPNACPDCGPVLQLVDGDGNPVLCKDVVEKAAELIRKGYIVALKGIGGFQLACDAGNDESVKTLRRRKHRPAKALALMAAHREQIEQYCRLSSIERELVESTAGPIVVLESHRGARQLSPHLAPGQNSLGFMLPYSPLHHRLMQLLDHPIVLTSGNASEEPQCIDNQQALDKLGDIADAFVLHNRDIVNRIDDSVVRVIDGQTQFYRRARGYAPSSIRLPPGFDQSSPSLACGAELKNTFALLDNGSITPSQHMGSLENLQTYDDYLKNLELYHQLFQSPIESIVIDTHPEYLSSKWGRQQAEQRDIELIEVQHHHAHIAACLADNQWSLQSGPVIGITLDGLGLGDDDTLWGGEFLVADYASYRRRGCLKPTPLIGGHQAMLEPWRNLLAQLVWHNDWQTLHDEFGKLEALQYLEQKPIETMLRMIQTRTNTPLSSSCGRLFDAVAAALGISRDRLSYEGQAAIELEALVMKAELQICLPYPFEIEHGELNIINPAPMWQALLHDLKKGTESSLIATRFHSCVAHMLLSMSQIIRSEDNINSVALSGGVFQNPSLLSLTRRLLLEQGFEVMIHQQVPANDGGLSLGQAAVAAARQLTSIKERTSCV